MLNLKGTFRAGHTCADDVLVLLQGKRSRAAFKAGAGCQPGQLGGQGPDSLGHSLGPSDCGHRFPQAAALQRAGHSGYDDSAAVRDGLQHRVTRQICFDVAAYLWQATMLDRGEFWEI